MVVQAKSALPERLMAEPRQIECKGSYRGRLIHSRDELPESKVMNGGIRGRAQRVGSQSGRALSKGRLDKRIEAVKMRVV